jgi:hypothetical protein
VPIGRLRRIAAQAAELGMDLFIHREKTYGRKP